MALLVLFKSKSRNRDTEEVKRRDIVKLVTANSYAVAMYLCL